MGAMQASRLLGSSQPGCKEVVPIHDISLEGDPSYFRYAVKSQTQHLAVAGSRHMNGHNRDTQIELLRTLEAVHCSWEAYLDPYVKDMAVRGQTQPDLQVFHQHKVLPQYLENDVTQ